MKTLFKLVALSSLWLALSVQAGVDLEREQARQVAQQYMKTLKGTLMQAMQNGGPVKAIGVCREQAGSIARQIEAETGWKVGRTSLKLRNPHNAPDPWAKEVLQQFQRDWKGEPMEHAAWSQDGRTFRYMKTIAVQPPCLSCHGEKLAPEVKQALQRLYPEDQATGYRAGDLRGALLLEYQRK